MTGQTLYQTYQRFRTLRSGRISSLPIVILMPHSACNCRCVMCDIWKDNKNLKQLTVEDVKGLLGSLNRLGTKQVVFSGGEALLNPRFFELCALLRERRIFITLLSTGITLEKHAAALAENIDELIVSLDGDEATHDSIRNIPGAFEKMRKGINALLRISPGLPVRGRTVIHKLNFRIWPEIIRAAHHLSLRSISFLPADLSSHAFNREMPWTAERQADIAIQEAELPELKAVLESLLHEFQEDFRTGFIAESPEKLSRIYTYYAAIHGLGLFPQKKCNAPWVSAVVEADGSVRPCFFHAAMGNIHSDGFLQILNNEKNLQFRRKLKKQSNDTCTRCVCSLNLPLFVNPVNSQS